MYTYMITDFVQDLDSMNVADYYISVLQTFCLFDTIGSSTLSIFPLTIHLSDFT